ncbi:MAG TPA: tetratricopeptide repeat protein, partial [Pilimelia sp.]|nr:tetratricopeptide repeat protein [Pilimelia sp.]
AQVAVLSGTAGAGKTALAVHWAHRASARFPDGPLYVNLRGFDAAAAPMSPGEAVRGFLDAFGVTAARVPAGLAAQAALYRSLLAERRVLVVLDNAHDADQVRPLLPGSATCRTVVTSRNALSGLVAVEGAQPIGVGLLSVGEARLLLAYRIGPHRLRDEPAAADDIINRCARLPLALAIAAARASARPGTALRLLADELDAAGDGLAAFTGEDAAGDARTAFRCSYHHLSAPAATLFRLLGLHPGPDVGTAAAASLAGWPVAAVRPVLMELTGAHLLTEHRPGRYAAHDLLRAYAIEQARLLDPGTERRSAVHRLLDHYLHAARAAAMLLYPHRDPVTVPAPRPGVTRAEPADAAAARAWFQAEHPVLTRLVRLAADGFGTHAWQLAWALGDFLDWCGHWHDLAATQTDALAAAAALGDRPGEGHARRNLARAFIRLGRYAGARSLLDEAVVLSAGAGDLIGQAHSRLDLALVEERGGAHRPALQHARRALDLFSAAGHRIGQARALNAVGWYHTLLGDHDEAVTCIERALALHLVLGNRLGQAATWDSLGFAQHQLGEHGRAAASYGRAVSLFREAGDRFHEADTLIHLGDTHEVAGAPDLARATWRRALGLLEDLRHPAAAELRPRLAR